MTLSVTKLKHLVSEAKLTLENTEKLYRMAMTAFNKDDYELLNIIYDLIAQNPIKGVYSLTHDELTDMVDHVDEETQEIVFNSPRKDGKQFTLKLTIEK